MSTLSKVLRIITFNKRISDKLLNLVYHDPHIPNLIKRKVYLYYNNDKRLSIEKLKEAIRKLQQKGGNQEPLAGVQILNFGKGVTYDGIPYEQLQQTPELPTITINNTRFTIGNKIGEGSFAEVFLLINNGDNTQTYVLKLFKQINEKLQDNIKSCIIEFINLRQLYILHTSFPSFAHIFVDNPRFGYIVKKHDGALQSLITGSIDTPDVVLNALKTVVTYLDPSKMYLHGDIKIENILYSELLPYLHDFDSVFVYDKSLLHISDIPYRRQIDMTVLFCHPFLPWYAHHLQKATSTEELISNMIADKENHMQIWISMFLYLAKLDKYNLQSYMVEYLNSIYEEQGFKSYDFFIKDVFSNDVSKITAWMGKHIGLLDRYSLGASVLVYSQVILPKRKNLSSTDSKKIDLLSNVMFNFAYTIISQAITTDLKLSPLPSEGGSIKRKMQKGGSNVPGSNVPRINVDLSNEYNIFNQTVAVVNQTQSGGNIKFKIINK